MLNLIPVVVIALVILWALGVFDGGEDAPGYWDRK